MNIGHGILLPIHHYWTFFCYTSQPICLNLALFVNPPPLNDIYFFCEQREIKISVGWDIKTEKLTLIYATFQLSLLN